MKRPGGTVRRSQVAAAAAVITLGLAGCSTLSPAIITTPYPAADGTSGTIPGSGIKLSNFLVVSSAKGAPGQVVGAVGNDTATPITVTMQTDLGSSGKFGQTTIKVPAHGITQVGPSGTQIIVSDTPVAPGATMGVSANSPSSGGVTLSVPVVPPTGYYQSYTVAPTPAPLATTVASTGGPVSTADSANSGAESSSSQGSASKARSTAKPTSS